MKFSIFYLITYFNKIKIKFKSLNFILKLLSFETYFKMDSDD